ncbi:MAG TPA: hypothetical protein VIJ57_16505 [Hanamia sp.]
MKTKKSDKFISKGNQDKKPTQKVDEDPKQFEEERSMNIRMKPQPLDSEKKTTTPKKENKKK